MTSKQLGLLSIALSIASVPVLHVGVKAFPAASTAAFFAAQAAALVCGVLAALRGNKWWLLAAVVPLLHALVLIRKIID
ncbi:MAG TPA: hypothetical protein VE083_09495 [Terriglobales bacterium]|nr:hypothetical protein [Terriglobales bacterium]